MIHTSADPERHRRRRHVVEIPARGRDGLVDAQHRLRAVEDHLLGTLSEAERTTLHDLLARAAGGHRPQITATAQWAETTHT